MKNHVTAIIVAGGNGSRMGGQYEDKLFAEINGVSVIERTLTTFLNTETVNDIVLVVRADRIDKFKTIVEGMRSFGKSIQLAEGGVARRFSVFNGIALLPPETTHVAIHDGARPMITPEQIDTIINSAVICKAAAAGCCVNDTLKSVKDGIITATVDRSHLIAVQTPQVFELGLYKSALNNADLHSFEYTDDCALVERIGVDIHVCDIGHGNIKITTPQDLLIAESMISIQNSEKERKSLMRIGHGYDVHCLSDNRRLILGGVCVPFEKGLLGHSDADVLLHAIMDALLGAAALGDIGKHFPDSDNLYEGISSIVLLEMVVALIHEKGYTVGNIDATLIAQRPKLSPFIGDMVKNIADAVGIDCSFVNVKATTEEGLGFTGNGGGIASHSVCTLFISNH